MDDTTITESNIDTSLPTDPSRTYGTTGLDLSWNSIKTQLTVTLGAGETIVGGETVNPAASVTDEDGNADQTSGTGPAIGEAAVEGGALKWWHILLIALSGLIVIGGLIVLFVLPRRPPSFPEEGYEEEF